MILSQFKIYNAGVWADYKFICPILTFSTNHYERQNEQEFNPA